MYTVGKIGPHTCPDHSLLGKSISAIEVTINIIGGPNLIETHDVDADVDTSRDYRR